MRESFEVAAGRRAPRWGEDPAGSVAAAAERVLPLVAASGPDGLVAEQESLRGLPR